MFANINEVLKIKENFFNLSAKKIKNINKTVNKLRNEKPCINIRTKSPFRRQSIVPMDNNNISNSISSSSEHISNIHKAFKNTKFNILAESIHNNH